jgi:AcrR family transcriptional regulator
VTDADEPRWRRRPHARREEILDAAQRRFTTDGVEGTTIAAIATEAGVAKGSVYRYFESKDALLSSLKDRFFDEMGRRTLEIIEAMPSAGRFELADAAIAATVRFLFEQAPLVELWCHDVRTQEGDEFSRGMDTFTAIYEAAIVEAVAEGTMACEDPRTTAMLLLYAVQGTVTRSILHGGPGPDEVVRAATTMTRRVLGPP